MWEKKDSKAKAPDVKPVDTRVESSVTSNSPVSPAPPPPLVSSPPSPATTPLNKETAPSARRDEMVRIGRSIVVKGEISGSQDLIIEGNVEGKIDLRTNQVVIGEGGRISGEIMARHLIIQGQVVGNTYAEERLEIRSSGSLRGDIMAPRIVIEDGAFFKGSVEMDSRKEGHAKEAEKRSSVTYEAVVESKH